MAIRERNGTPPESADSAVNASALPVVVPLTGAYIAQLFLVPGIIVTVAVLILLAFSWLVGGSLSAEQLLTHLDDSNEDVRWRAAYDLAQALPRNEQLASNPKFALDLTERLHRAFVGNEQSERDLAVRLADLRKSGATPTELYAEQEPLRKRRRFLLLLCSCVGHMTIPVAVPVLNELALKEDDADENVVAKRRWQAVWALANLGERIERFNALLPEQQQTILDQLEQEATGDVQGRGGWAKDAANLLKSRQNGTPIALGVDKTLARCAEHKNPFLRKTVAMALTFWEGTAAENQLIEETLVKLARDDGHGEENSQQIFDEEDYPAGGFRMKPGSDIRYQATLSLARRSSPSTRLDLVQEMLDLNSLLDNFRLKNKDGSTRPDEYLAQGLVLDTLNAVRKLHAKRPLAEPARTELRSAVERLVDDSTVVIQTEARNTLNILDGK